MLSNADVDRENAQFWEVICGSQLAKDLGATDFSSESLNKVDTFFMDFYSYVHDWLKFAELRGADVLEVGLGYGTIGQRIALAGARYTGLDVAAAPVGLMNLRLKLAGTPGLAVQGSILSAPFPDRCFDHVVAFGCLHHTGEIQGALKEASRLLRSGGKLTMMVYYAYSYRMLYQRGFLIMKDVWADYHGATDYSGDPAERALYDANAQGVAAPHTVFVSRRQLRRMADAAGLKVDRAATENSAAYEMPFPMPRGLALKTYAKVIGGDLYAVLSKPN